MAGHWGAPGWSSRSTISSTSSCGWLAPARRRSSSARGGGGVGASSGEGRLAGRSASEGRGWPLVSRDGREEKKTEVLHLRRPISFPTWWRISAGWPARLGGRRSQRIWAWSLELLVDLRGGRSSLPDAVVGSRRGGQTGKNRKVERPEGVDVKKEEGSLVIEAY